MQPPVLQPNQLIKLVVQAVVLLLRLLLRVRGKLFSGNIKTVQLGGSVTNGLPTGAAYLTPTTNTLTVSNISVAGNYLFRCLVNGGGCSNAKTDSVSLSVVGVPVAPTINPSLPNGTNVCVGATVSSTFTSGTGGVGNPTDTIQYSINGTNWLAYTSGTSITASTIGTSVLGFRTKRTATSSGCTTATNSTLYNVVAIPVAPTISATITNGSTVCVGATVSATISAGTGGAGNPTDTVQYTINGTNWLPYTSGTSITASTTGTNVLGFRTKRTATNSGCTTAINSTLYNVAAVPVAPTISATLANGSTVCVGATVSATISAGTGGSGNPTDTIQYTINGTNWLPYTSGTSITASTIGTSVLGFRTKRTATGSGCTTATSSVLYNVVTVPIAPTISATYANGSTVCIGTTVSATISAGTGGAGNPTDTIQYTINGINWLPYTSGASFTASTIGNNVLGFRTKRTATNSGCTTATSTLLYNVVAAPVAQTISATFTDGSTVCVGTNVSASFTGGSGGSPPINNIYESTTDGINWVTYTPNNLITAFSIGTSVLGFRTKRTATGGGCASSTYVIVMYNVVAAPNIILQPFNNTKCLGDSSTFTVAVNGGFSLSYQWQYFNGTAWNNVTNGSPSGAIYNNQTSASLKVKGIVNAGIYSYQCKVTSGGNGCTSPLISNTSNLTLNVLPVPIISNNISICAGANASLVAGGGIGYVWTPAIGLNSAYISNPIATPTATTSFSVVVTDANNCSATSNNIVVTVNASPTINAGANASVCLGSSTTLQASGGTNYSWTPTIGLSNPAISNPIATVTTNTTYTVTVTNTNGCSSTDNVLVSINTLPSANAGIDVSICNGDSTTLNASGGLTYSWNPPIGLSATNIANPTAKPNLPTTYTVTVTDTNGCIDIDSIVVSINQPITPVVNGNINVCRNSYWESYTANTNSNSYSWSVTGGNIMYGQNTYSIFVHWLNGSIGTVNLNETSNSTGCENSTSLNVSINSNLAPDTVEIKLKSDDILICTDSTFTTYKWGYESKVTGTPIFTCSNTQYCHFTSFDPSNFYYWVIVGHGNGCETKSYYVTPNFNGIKNTEPNNKLKIYPNPANEIIKIDYVLNAIYSDLKIDIYNVLGEKVHSQKLNTANGSASINSSQFPIGVYQINLSNHNQIIKSQKQIIVR